MYSLQHLGHPNELHVTAFDLGLYNVLTVPLGEADRALGQASARWVKIGLPSSARPTTTWHMTACMWSMVAATFADPSERL